MLPTFSLQARHILFCSLITKKVLEKETKSSQEALLILHQLTCEIFVTHQFTDLGTDRYTPFKSGFAFLATKLISKMLTTITFLSIVFTKCFTSPLQVF